MHDVLMTRPAISHVLLDFFGTMVAYSPSRTEQGYPASHALVTSLGGQLSYSDFLMAWEYESALFDARSAHDDSEFSMYQVAAAFLARALGRVPDRAEAAAFAATYVREWSSAIVYPSDMPGLIEALARQFRLAVVTNTHEPDLVPLHLAAMGIARHIDAVITSVEVGWRKPHPAIYAEALHRLGITAASAVFAGDTYAADYAGPSAAGIRAYLIDPTRQHIIPADRRLRSLADLPGRLREH